MRARNRVSSRRRRKKIVKQASGFRGRSSSLYRLAVEKVHRALQYAYRDRRVKKRDFRSLWVTRIGIASKINGLSYSQLIFGLKKAQVGLDRKILAELAVSSPDVFKQIVDVAKSKISA